MGRLYQVVDFREEIFRKQGIDIAGWRIADGSGLSRKNVLTAEQLVKLLITMKNSEFFPLFFESLSSPREGIRGKSGRMTLVSNYAGYSKDIAFAILINQCTDSQRARERIEEFFTFIVNYSLTSL